MDIPPNVLSALLGLVGGAALGASARYTGFCSFAAIADWRASGDLKRWRGWLLAIAVAIAGTQALDLAGLVDISLSGYLSPSFFWAGAVLGGLVFGFGMALAGGCGLGLLIRAGAGDGRALFGMMTLAIAGYATMRGVFALLRMDIVNAASTSLNGAGSQNMGDLLAWTTGMAPGAASALVASLAVIGIAAFCLRDTGFRQSRHLLGGVVLGGAAVWGWAATGWLAADPFEPVRLESYTFVRPVGDALLYIMTYTGASATFAIGSVGGVLLGAFGMAWRMGELRVETCDHPRDFGHMLLGATLMGVGGVFASGCTIGQGVSAISVLAISGPITLLFLIIGASLGMRYLLEGISPFNLRRF
jgi:uncharacterized protein